MYIGTHSLSCVYGDAWVNSDIYMHCLCIHSCFLVGHMTTPAFELILYDTPFASYLPSPD